MNELNPTLTSRRPLVFKIYKEKNNQNDIFKESFSDKAPSIEEDYVDCSFEDIISQDLSGAVILYDPTYYCNMECSFCDLPIKSKQAVDLDSIRYVLTGLSIIGVRDIVLTGGEPGIYNKLTNFLSLSSYLKFRVCMLTNGTWAATQAHANKIVEKGLDQIVISLKSFSRHQSLKITGKDFHNLQISAIKNLSCLVKKGNLRDLTINHVLCDETLDEMHNVEWIKNLDIKPKIVISLVEPYTIQMMKLVPDLQKLKSSLKYHIDMLQNLGAEVKVEGLPLCLLDSKWILSRDLHRRNEQRPKILIRPYMNADYVLYYKGYQRIMQFKYVDKCENCSLIGKCPGIHIKYAEQWNKYISPIDA